MFERYTEKARRAIFFSRYEASQFGSPVIDTEHLLLGLLREDKSIVTRLSRRDFEYVRRRMEELKPPGKTIPTSGDLPLSAACKRIVAYTAEEAERLAQRHIGTEHLLLGLLRESDCFAAKILSEAGVDLRAAREAIAQTERQAPRAAQPPPGRDQDFVEIHGVWLSLASVRELSELYRKFWWEKRQWSPRDALARRSDKRLFLYTGQTFDPKQAEVVKGGWTENHCVICSWKLDDSPEHRDCYTNGQDWLCKECHERFINPTLPPTV